MLSVRVGEEAFFCVMSSADLWKEFKKYMYPGKRTSNFYDYKDGDKACYYGYFGLIKERGDFIITNVGVIGACYSGNLDLVIWLKINKVLNWGVNAMDNACSSGNLELVKFLHHNREEEWSDRALNNAIKFGHLEILKWLHNNTSPGYSEHALKNAIDAGNLEVFEFLFLLPEEEYPFNRISLLGYSCCGSNLEIVKYIIKNTEEKLTITGVLDAIEGGNLEIFKYTLGITKEKLSNDEADLAADDGSLEILMYMYSELELVCTEKGMFDAAINGYLSIVEFLYERSPEIYTDFAMDKAIMGKNLKIVKFFCENIKGLDLDELLRKARGARAWYVVGLPTKDTDNGIVEYLEGLTVSRKD